MRYFCTTHQQHSSLQQFILSGVILSLPFYRYSLCIQSQVSTLKNTSRRFKYDSETKISSPTVNAKIVTALAGHWKSAANVYTKSDNANASRSRPTSLAKNTTDKYRTMNKIQKYL